MVLLSRNADYKALLLLIFYYDKARNPCSFKAHDLNNNVALLWAHTHNLLLIAKKAGQRKRTQYFVYFSGLSA